MTTNTSAHGTRSQAANPPETKEANRARPPFLELLHLQGFRNLCVGNGFAFMGMRMRDMVIAWMVLEMTNSQLWVGLVIGLPTFTIILFSMVGGALADRRDRRTLLLWSRMSLAILSFGAAFLTMIGAIEIWHLIILTSIAAGITAHDMSISRVIMRDMVGGSRLLSATSINSIMTDIGALAGPFLAGIAIGKLGTDAALFILVGIYALAFFSLLTMKRSPNVLTGSQGHIIRDIIDGLSYIRRTPETARLVSLSVTVPLAGVFVFATAIYARDVLEIGSRGLGILLATYSAGALLGSFLMVLQGDIRRKRAAVFISAVVYAAGMTVFAFSTDVLTSIVTVFVIGICSAYWKNITTTVVQNAIADEMRGRVMSIFGMSVQLMALGWLFGGIVSVVIGIQWTLVLAAVLMVLVNLQGVRRSASEKKAPNPAVTTAEQSIS